MTTAVAMTMQSAADPVAMAEAVFAAPVAVRTPVVMDCERMADNVSRDVCAAVAVAGVRYSWRRDRRADTNKRECCQNWLW